MKLLPGNQTNLDAAGNIELKAESLGTPEAIARNFNGDIVGMGATNANTTLDRTVRTAVGNQAVIRTEGSYFQSAVLEYGSDSWAKTFGIEGLSATTTNATGTIRYSTESVVGAGANIIARDSLQVLAVGSTANGIGQAAAISDGLSVASTPHASASLTVGSDENPSGAMVHIYSGALFQADDVTFRAEVAQHDLRASATVQGGSIVDMVPTATSVLRSDTRARTQIDAGADITGYKTVSIEALNAGVDSTSESHADSFAIQVGPIINATNDMATAFFGGCRRRRAARSHLPSCRSLPAAMVML